MGYRRMDKRDLWRIYRRWRDGRSVSRIADNEARDRKTVREYIEALISVGVTSDGQELERPEFYRRVEPLLPKKNHRPTPVRDVLSPYRDEIFELIRRKTDPLKPKYAFETIKRKYGLTVSYTTFKRFARVEDLSTAARRR